jgi:lipopolysaccharide biosynthesis glycosyltransferase
VPACNYSKCTRMNLNIRPDRTFAVAFCADRHVEASLHVASSSLLRNLDPTYLARLYFLLTGFSQARVDLLRKTLDLTGRPYDLRLLALPDSSLFGGFRPLHGSMTIYHRLALPDLVDEERLLYLDSDTLTQMDVSPLAEIDMGDRATGFVITGRAGTSIYREFYLAHGLRADGPQFNSGVMLFNVPEWRRQHCRERFLGFEQKEYDQPILNVMFSESTCRLPEEFNLQMTPTHRLEGMAARGIHHYVGVPKPWDLGGNFLHRSYPRWREELAKTAIGFNPYFDPQSWVRSLHLLGGYKRTIEARFQEARR